MKIPPSIYKFIISGGIATCIDLICYLLLRQFLWTAVSKTVSMLIANVWSYTVNKQWVFSSQKESDMKTIGTYIIVQVLNLTTNVGVNSLTLHFTGGVLLAFVVATLSATILNYTLQKFIVFK